MKSGSVIHILGLDCRPDQDEKFNRWYNDVHIPDLLKFRGVERATRYRCLYKDETTTGFPKVNYPQYLAIYKMDSQAVFEEYESSQEMADSLKELRATWAGDPFQRTWRVQFRLLQNWGNEEPGKIVHLLGSRVRPDQEEKYNTWFNEKHVRDLLKVRKLKGIQRYQALYPDKVYPGYPEVKYPYYLAICHFEDVKDYEAYETSPELEAAHRDYRANWSADPYERVWRVQFEQLKDWIKR